MKLKKTKLSTMLSDLYGRDNYQSHIEVGREYWYYFSEGSQAYNLTHKYWNKIKITYIRSGCLFYVLSDVPEFKEEFCPTSCFMASTFVCAELDPIKDLGDKLENIEAAKLTYCFDDEHTIIKNWPNEREIEIDEEEIYNKFGKLDNPQILLAIYAMFKLKEV